MKTETETLLESINLSIDDVYAIIKKGVSARNKSIEQLHNYTSIEDMTQDVLAYYLSVMQSTNDIRLNYYIRKYHDREHIINLIKQSSYQYPLELLRKQDFKSNATALSLYNIVADKDGPVYLIDTLEAKDDYIAKLMVRLNDEKFLDDLTNSLMETNFELLKNDYIKHEQSHAVEKLPFLLNVKNFTFTYSYALKRTKQQLCIIKDFLWGFTKKELAKKYAQFKKDLIIIKKVLGEKCY